MRERKHNWIKTAFVVFMLLLVCHNTGAKQNANYMQLMNIPTQKLNKMAWDMLHQQPLAYDRALLCYTVVMNRYSPSLSDEDKHEINAAFNNAGYIYYYFYYDYVKAYSCYRKAIEVCEECNDLQNMSNTFLNMGNLYMIIAEQYESDNMLMKAIDYYKKGVHASIETKKWNSLITSFTNLTDVAFDRDRLNSIDAEMKAFSKQPLPQNVDMYDFAKLQYQWIDACRHKRYNDALALLSKQAKHVNTQLTPERYIANIYSSRAHILIKTRRYREAEKCLKQQEHYVDSVGLKDFKTTVASQLEVVYRALGDSAKAHDYHIRYIEAKDSFIASSNLQRVSEIQFLDEIHRADMQMQQMASDRRAQNIVLIVVGVGAVVLSILLFVIYRKNKDLKEGNRALYEKNEQLLANWKTANTKRDKPAANADHSREKYQNSSLSDDDKDAIAKAIDKVFEDADTICSTDFSLDRLAELIGNKPKNVSQVVNEVYGRTLTALITEARIREACRRLNDIEHYGKFTIESISQSVGFKSRANFVSNFKRVTGLTPSAYQKIAKEQKQ